MSGLERLRQGLVDRGYGDRLMRDEPLSRHTSFAIGGPADLFIAARQPAEMVEWARLAWAEGVPMLVIGSGTNILVADAGVRGLVVANECRGYAINEQYVLAAQSGALLREVARATVERGLAGLAWAIGVPGTMGGAVIGNAGAYGGCMADVVMSVQVLSPDGQVRQLDRSALDYSYRNSALKRMPVSAPRPIVLDATIQLQPGDREELARQVQGIAEQRKQRTPAGCCAGSVFKRTLQYPAGFLIEQAGLKGERIGGAEISPKHANFIMNVGGATAADVKALIELAQERVWAAFGERLEPEIEFVGEWR